MFKRKALEKLKYWKEKRHQSILFFRKGQGVLENRQLPKNLQSRGIGHI